MRSHGGLYSWFLVSIKCPVFRRSNCALCVFLCFFMCPPIRWLSSKGAYMYMYAHTCIDQGIVPTEQMTNCARSVNGCQTRSVSLHSVGESMPSLGR